MSCRPDVTSPSSKFSCLCESPCVHVLNFDFLLLICLVNLIISPAGRTETMARGKHDFFSTHGLASQPGETQKPVGEDVGILVPIAVVGVPVWTRGPSAFLDENPRVSEPGRVKAALCQGQRYPQTLTKFKLPTGHRKKPMTVTDNTTGR